MRRMILCHLCNGKMYREKDKYICVKCTHEAEAILPPNEVDELFKEEIQYKESVSKRGSGGSSNVRGGKKAKRGVPWYDIDRIASEGSPGQGFK